MRVVTLSLLALALGLALADSAAAGILWGTPTNIAGDADVSHSGAFVDGLQGFSGSPTISIGDATFHQGTATPTLGSPAQLLSTPSGDISLSQDTGFAYGAFNGGSAAYNQLVNQNGNNTNSEAGTATLSGLQSGNVYQVELWSATVGYGTTTTLDGAVTLNGGQGQFVLGTFTASGSTETFTYTGSDGSRISAVELRILTPEPKSVIIWALAFGAGMLAIRRNRKA